MFKTPKDFKEYEKLVNEAVKVRKELNEKVIAEKVGTQSLFDEQSKIQAPTIKRLKNIEKAIYKPVFDNNRRPVFDVRTGKKVKVPITEIIYLLLII